LDYKRYIQKAIDYIEENLKSEIKIEALAQVAGYSTYHFLRVFKETLHLTPADYIRKRRLTEIAKELMRGDKYISDIAFEYGFNSKENFVRAFKNEHHITPTEFKKSGNSLKLYEKMQLDSEPFIIIPEIVQLEDIHLTVYPSDEEYPPHFWNKYNCRKLSKKLSGGKVCEDFGISVWTGKLSYYIGIRTEEAKGDTSGTIEMLIPGGKYAVFTTPEANHFNFISEIHKTWNYINTRWVHESGYKRRDGPQFETYVEESKTFREKIFIPID